MKVVAVIGYKNTGKTTFVCRLVEKLALKGKVGTVKIMHDHRFDSPKKDTGKHFDSGAENVTAVSEEGMVSIQRGAGLDEALEVLAGRGMDYAIVEGATNSDLPKIMLGEMDEEAGNVVLRLAPCSDWDMDEVAGIVQQTSEFVTLNSMIDRIRHMPEFPLTGSIGTFTGVVRGETDDISTKMLEFEKYESVADERIEKICNDLKQREGIIEVLIHHKSGRLMRGEDIVYIAVASAHRQELFNALSDAIERVKSEVPIWKKEVTLEGDFWVHDHA